MKAIPRYDCRREIDRDPVPAWWLASYEDIDHWVDLLTTVLDNHYSPALRPFMEFYGTSDGHVAELMTWQIIKMLRSDPLFILENWPILQDYKTNLSGIGRSLGQDDISQLEEMYRGIFAVNPGLRPACLEIIAVLKEK